MKIPKLIHQTVYDKTDMHPAFLSNIAGIRSLNDDWQYFLYDEQDMLKFIAQEYGAKTLSYYERISLAYGAARSDFFRYLLLYKYGGVYLDIKSTTTKKLSTVIKADDSYILTHWNSERGSRYEGWGWHPELGKNPEYQQWHIIAAPRHPFLKAVVDAVKKNIDTYDPVKIGTGKYAVIRTTGPIAYTKAILGIRDQHSYRFTSTQEMGLQFSIFEEQKDPLAHHRYFKNHYTQQTSPLILPAIKTTGTIHVGRNQPCPCGSGKKYKYCHGAK